jgi:Fe-Mn family superoxide dismutase
MKTLILIIMITFTLPPLPYEYEALKPTMSEETLRYHHDKHHLAYVNNLNKLIKGTEFEDAELVDIVRHAKGSIFNNAAQVWNHTFFFEQFGTWTPLNGQLAEQIVRQWGTIEKFKEEFVATGMSQFGSGWVWLVCNKDGELSILTESNAGNPLTKGYIPLLTFDVWEHAYYVDYRNQRGDYLNALWQILDWRIIEDRYMFFLDY